MWTRYTKKNDDKEVFTGKALIIYYSNNQNVIESEEFGAESVALKEATEANIELQYKLKMMGVEIKGEENMLYENQRILLNTSLPESTLKRYLNIFAYHTDT